MEDSPHNASEDQSTRLRDAFAALGHDAELRKANLEALVTSLTNTEATTLETMLKVRKRVDHFALLPIELRVEIAQYLDATDIASVLNVNKAWRSAWGLGDVFETLARRWLPGFIEYYHERKKLEQLAQGDIQRHFYEAARSLRYRCLAQFTNTKYFDTTSEIGLPRLPRSVMYEAGTAAWQDRRLHSPIKGWNICTNQKLSWDLHDGVSFLLSGDRLGLKAVGDKLIVIAEGHMVYAVHLKTGESKSVSLGSAMRDAQSQGDYVYMMHHRQLLFWVWNFRSGSVKAVEVSHYLDGYGGPSGHGALFTGRARFLFHPLQPDIFFVALVHTLEFGVPRSLIVLKYDNGDYVESFQFDLPEDLLDWTQCLPCSGPSKVNEYGLYKIVSLNSSRRFGAADHIPPEASLFFNTVTCAFSVERYRRGTAAVPPQDILKLTGGFERREHEYYTSALLERGMGQRIDFNQVNEDFYVDRERLVMFVADGFHVAEFGKPPAT